MKRAQRLLAVTVGAAAIALGAVALAGPAAAAPSGSPSPSSSPGSPGSPSAAPSTSDKPSNGTKAGPPVTVYDMALSASDVVFESHGPARGLTSSVGISVRNNGTVAQPDLTVAVVEPSDAHLTGLEPGASGIDNCLHGTEAGLGVYYCQVHDRGPGQVETARFGITADVPLPAGTPSPYGRVTLHGYHQPDAHAGDNDITFSVFDQDTSKPAEAIDLVTTAKPVTMKRQGPYRGLLSMSVTNRGDRPVPPVTLEIEAPQGAEVTGNADDGFPYPCVRIGGSHGLVSGLRCQIGETLQPGQTFSATWVLMAEKPDTHGTLGIVDAYVTGDHVYTDPKHDNVASYQVTFAADQSGTGSGSAAGSGTSLPVTGTPLGLIAGGGAVVLAAGGALLALSRRRKSHQ
jgi:hypothetical protein